MPLIFIGLGGILALALTYVVKEIAVELVRWAISGLKALWKARKRP
jgi:hypothetical protein